MSIIYEALKKIEEKEDPKVESCPLSIDKIVEPKEQQFKKEPSYHINKFVFFAIVGVGVFSLFLFHPFYHNHP